jgi:hypothetical protein
MYHTTSIKYYISKVYCIVEHDDLVPSEYLRLDPFVSQYMQCST